MQRKGNGEQMKAENQGVCREQPETVGQQEGQRGTWEPDPEQWEKLRGASEGF